jgi:hypothetical protein
VLGTSIWCDAARARGVSFLSRADVSLGSQRRAVSVAQAISSERTASMRRALGLPGGDALVPRFGRPFALGRARLELLPAGGIAGASQLLVELGDWRGLYAGELATSVGGEARQVRACDVLVVDAPEAGGVRDEPDALTAAVKKGETLVCENLLALFGLVERLGRERLALPSRWARVVGRVQGAKRKERVRVLFQAGPREGRLVRAGLRAPDEDSIALGLRTHAEDIVAFVAHCGAKIVHVRLHEGPLRRAGARALVDALRAQRIEARPLGPPEQLSLL